jgi:hypothetical protein
MGCILKAFICSVISRLNNLVILQKLIENVDRDLKHAIEEEGKVELDVVTNYDDVKEEINCKVGAHFSACIVYKLPTMMLTVSYINIFVVSLLRWSSLQEYDTADVICRDVN